MRHSLIIASLASVISSTVSADFIGFEIGAYSWQQNYEGIVQSGTQEVDLTQQLGFDDETNNSYYLVFEHPVPVIPNLLIQHTELDITASNPSANFTFDGIDFDTAIDTQSDLSHTDITLYYEVLDNWVSLDIGLTARSFEEGIKISSAIDSAELDIDETLPMLYLSAEIELPLTGLYISADINAISYRGDGFSDYRINVGYESSLGLGAELGYRSFDIDYEDEDEVADITIDGAYLGVFYHF
ncbi:MAG: TIGR04219 family outer membrane beta-barrel protein [Spongiibacteraceae bacterium]|nr:TIGR04219 family outer membrane beta-barrel protein [Spongiibacteraceae bacterium]